MALEVAPASIGLVPTTVGGPGHRCVHEVFGLVADVEQAADLGEGQVDQPPERSGRLGLFGGNGADVQGVGVGVGEAGCRAPFFARCRWARTARKTPASMARVTCRYQAW